MCVFLVCVSYLLSAGLWVKCQCFWHLLYVCGRLPNNGSCSNGDRPFAISFTERREIRDWFYYWRLAVAAAALGSCTCSCCLWCCVAVVLDSGSSAIAIQHQCSLIDCI